MDGERRGLRLGDWVLLVILGVLVIILGFVVFTMSSGLERVAYCGSNLSQLWKMENIYASMYGRMPSETGKDFWLKVRKVGLVGPTEKKADDIFKCPNWGKDSPDCQYRGPAVDVATLKDNAIVGADDVGNHGDEGGNLIRKDGDVDEIPDRSEFAGLTKDLK